MTARHADLSRLELRVLAGLWPLGEASAREVLGILPLGTTYSTVRKILERLESKGAVTRRRREGRAWIYAAVRPAAETQRREIARLLDSIFAGRGAALLEELLAMGAVGEEDLRRCERRREAKAAGRGRPG